MFANGAAKWREPAESWKYSSDVEECKLQHMESHVHMCEWVRLHKELPVRKERGRAHSI